MPSFGAWLRIASAMPEDDLLPAALDAEAQRFFHGSQTDVALADLPARFGLDVAAHQNRRTRGQIGQRI